MSIKKELKTSDILANVIIEGMREIKAKEIVSLDLRGL
jgi:ribosomal silencing factor RsfS